MNDGRRSTLRRLARMMLLAAETCRGSGSVAVGSRSVAIHDAAETQANAHNGVAMHTLLLLSRRGGPSCTSASAACYVSARRRSNVSLTMPTCATPLHVHVCCLPLFRTTPKKMKAAKWSWKADGAEHVDMMHTTASYFSRTAETSLPRVLAALLHCSSRPALCGRALRLAAALRGLLCL